MGATKVNCWVEDCDKSPFDVRDDVPGTVVVKRLSESLRQVVKTYMESPTNNADTALYRATGKGKERRITALSKGDGHAKSDLKSLETFIQLASLKLGKNTKEDVEYTPVVCPNGHLNYIAVKKVDN